MRSSLLDTLRHYPHLYLLGVALLLLLPPLLYLTWRWDWRLLGGWRPRRALLVRGAGIALGVAAGWWCMQPAGPFAAVHARNTWEKLSDDAHLTNFFVSFRDAAVRLPPMSSDSEAQRRWGDTAGGLPAERAAPYPDIVQVLEEARSTRPTSPTAACRPAAWRCSSPMRAPVAAACCARTRSAAAPGSASSPA
ncbi:hypothetical protein [Rhodanobacter lindaniclasticus]